MENRGPIGGRPPSGPDVAMVASENPLRPSARSLAARFAFTCRAMPYTKPRRALRFGLRLKVPGISPFVFRCHSRIARYDRPNSVIPAILPFCSRPSFPSRPSPSFDFTRSSFILSISLPLFPLPLLLVELLLFPLAPELPVSCT